MMININNIPDLYYTNTIYISFLQCLFKVSKHRLRSQISVIMSLRPYLPLGKQFTKPLDSGPVYVLLLSVRGTISRAELAGGISET